MKKMLRVGISILFSLCFSFVICSTKTSPSLSTINIFIKSEDITPEEEKWYNSLPENELQYLSDIISISYDYGYNDGYDTGYVDGLFAGDAFQKGYETGYDMGYLMQSREIRLDPEDSPVPSSSSVTAPDTESVTIPSDSQDEETVWVGASGTKYHRYSCPTLKSTHREITLSEALAQGREPCKVCKP